MAFFRAILAFSRKYPVTRGMAMSGLLWPSSNFCEQTLQKREKYNFAEMARFSAFGLLVGAPAMYNWIKLTNYFAPGPTLARAVTKAFIGQILYSPMFISAFYLGVGTMEGKSWSNCVAELKGKFLPTFKTGLAVWPPSQTMCYLFVKEKNHVPVLATINFFWTMYLSYMKNLAVAGMQKQNQRKVEASDDKTNV